MNVDDDEEATRRKIIAIAILAHDFMFDDDDDEESEENARVECAIDLAKSAMAALPGKGYMANGHQPSPRCIPDYDDSIIDWILQCPVKCMHVISLTPDEFTVFLNLFEVDLKNNGGRNPAVLTHGFDGIDVAQKIINEETENLYTVAGYSRGYCGARLSGRGVFPPPPLPLSS
jgi:hypothetical protein